jgi:hypothetical protein
MQILPINYAKILTNSDAITANFRLFLSKICHFHEFRIKGIYTLDFLQYISLMHKIIIISFLFIAGFFAPANSLDIVSDLDGQLVYRVATGSAADVEILLNQGANPNAKNSLYRPVVIIGAARDNEDSAEIVKLLVEKGANLETKDEEGETAYTAAIQYGTIETINLLLQLKPSYKMTNASGLNLYELAKERRSADIMALLETLKTQEDLEWVRLTSRKNRQSLVKDFSYKICIEEYMVFYYSNDRMEETDMDAYDNKMTKLAMDINDIVAKLKKYFGLTRLDLGKVEEKTRKEISNQLAEMGSTGFRKRSGVGTDADLKRRCGRISIDMSMNSSLKTKVIKN